MLVLTIRTDKPESELGMFEDARQLHYERWQAHRQLAETINKKIEEILKTQSKSRHDIQAIVVFKGPGSFTGLRIGITVANTLADSLRIPIVSANGDDWVQTGISRLLATENERIALPEYGGEPNITQPKH